jgi:hypothetical protein
MQASFMAPFAPQRVISGGFGQTTPRSFPSAAGVASTHQLEQLVGEQGNDPKHQMKPDFKSSSHHHLAGP